MQTCPSNDALDGAAGETVIDIRYHIAGAVCLTLLAACGGGGSGGSITLVAGEQSEDPVVVEIPIAYITRPLPEESLDLRDPLAFAPGAQLLVRERSATTADDIDVTAQITALVAEEEGIDAGQLAVDVKGLESSFDGKTLIFSARVVAEPVDDNLEDTTWNLWTFDLDTQTAAYLIPSRIKRNEGVETGGGQDIDPHFLPDDRVVFSSTRQVASQARQLNEGRSQIFSALDEDNDEPAAVLHVYDPQGRNGEFEQISFNLSHDLDPTVTRDGSIVFSRWNNTRTNHISLYRIDPSGLELSPLYGYHSQSSGTEGAAVEYTQPRELDDGRIATLVRPFSPATFGGSIAIVDTATYAEAEQPLWGNEGASGPSQEPLTDTEIRTDGALSAGGQFRSVYPLRDGTQRLLVSWSDCRIIDEASGAGGQTDDYLPCKLQPDNNNPAPPVYGGWVYDPVADTQRPVVLAREGFLVSEIIAAEPRDFPALRPRPESFNTNLAIQGQGQLRIDSVYDLDGTDNSPLGIVRHATPGTPAYAARPARFLRVLQPVPIPDRDIFDIPDYTFGVTRGFGFREISGYVPIEPDGSVTVTVPAERPFTFSVVNAQGQRIGPRHDYWLQLKAGEVRRCSGCHSANNPLPHGRIDSQPVSSNPGARALDNGNTGFPDTRPDLFASAPGDSMAAVWDFQRPQGNTAEAARQLQLAPRYTDEWSGPGITPDATINDRDYDPAWTDIPADKPLIASNFEPGLPGRIVINYIDHIQPIWERERTAVDDGRGNMADRCSACHSSDDGARVPDGQLDLTATPSDIDADHYRSYRELLSADDEQWLDNGGVVADRQRVCTEIDENDNVLITTQTLPIDNSLRAGSAAGSGFFACFNGGSCGRDAAPALPDNCVEDGGEVAPATRDTIDHSGMLSAAELRLITEWVDIGAQYYNNPFDTRLAD